MAVTGVAAFHDARFKGNVDFYSSSFGGEAVFQRVWFEGSESVNVRGAVFQSNAFFFAVFAGGADFTYARFEQGVLLRARFDEPVTFDMCRFRGIADFSDLGLPGNEKWFATCDAWSLVGDHARPPGTQFTSVSFVHAEFAGDARFENVLFKERLDLRDCTFSNLLLPAGPSQYTRQLLPDCIDMRGCTYQRVSLELEPLLRTQSGDERLRPYDRQPYSELEHALRTAGDDKQADDVYLEWRREERKQQFVQGRFGSWIGSWIYKVLANYGVRPHQLAFASAVLVIAGTLFFEQPGTVRPKEARGEGATSHATTLQEAFFVTLEQFLPISIPVGDVLVPTTQPVTLPLTFGRKRVVIEATPIEVASILKILGWIFVPLGVASLSGFLRRIPGR
jgi:hypothetical protein